MVTHNGYNNLKLTRPVVTLGYFDGVHRGHSHLLAEVVKKAKETGGESVVVTFYPHPRSVVSGSNGAMTFLTSLEEKKILIEKAGIEHLIIIPFTPEFSKKEACDFIEEVLVKQVRIQYLIIGFNHHFGKGRGGNFTTVKECAERFGFALEQVKPVSVGDTDMYISSTIIRELLLNGDVEKAGNFLGYHYFMNGSVVEGNQLGRSVGFPTANINPDYSDKLIPKNGVYAVEVYSDGRKYYGMLNIGLRPTVNSTSARVTVEVNLFDFEEDIYGKKVTVVFRYRMRDEVRFESLEKLVDQLHVDKKQAIRLLNQS